MANQIEEVGLRLRADGVLETSKGMQVTADAVKQLGSAATAANRPLQNLGVSAGQTKAAFRQLPAQITDIWTSLASGQSVATVAIQQGGQIKDSFGGVVPAGRALISLLNPLNVALGGTAIAAGALVLAYAQGKSEQDEFARAMVLTGNASGVTMSQLVGMAQAISGVVGTQGQASAALAQMAGSAQVAGGDLQKFSELAIRMERVSIQSVDATVKQFAELGRSPLQAAIKLNEGLNFLTEGTYRQIRALAEQGRTAEAATVAQNALADVMKTRTEQLEGRLGMLETAWKGVGDAAKWTWDKMLGIGREETLREKIEKVQARLIQFQQGLPGVKVDGERMAAIRAEEKRLQTELSNLRLQESIDNRTAYADSERARKDKAAIAAAEEAKSKKSGGPSAADKALAERIALMQRIYGNGGNALARDNFRSSELADTGATNAAMEKANADAVEARAKAMGQAAQAAERDALAMERQVATLANQTAEIGLNEQMLLARKQALADQQISEAAAMLSVIEGAQGYEAQTDALKRQIAALQQLKAVQAQAFVRSQAEEARKGAVAQAERDKADNARRTEGIASSIEEGLLNGFRSGSSLADIFLRELKAQFARTVLRPIISPIAMGLAGGGGAGGLLSGLLGLFGGGSPLAGATGFGDYNSSALLAEVRHGGGLAGVESAAGMRSLPASTWRNAPRHHTGIGPDEVPAILQRKEGVFTEGQMKAMAPVSALAKAGGGPRITYAPTFHIDSRADRAQILADMQMMTRQSQAELVDMMQRRMA
jgi:phage-related minor tail protein